MNITREQATIMRALAIMFIALHNFFHLESFGLAQENETLFDLERTNCFFSQLVAGEPIIGVFFSFVGWCGVPVFVFFSGYGLSRKYIGKENVNTFQFLKHSYLKLLYLILPAALFFIPYYAIFGSWTRVLECLFSLTFLTTLVPGLSSIAPPFWYFSLTFQLYIVFYFLFYIKNRRLLILFGIIFLFLYYFMSPQLFPNATLLRYIRLSFVGWMPVFIFGMIIGQNTVSIKNLIAPESPRCRKNAMLLMSIIVMIISGLAILLMNLNYYLWVLMPFVAICFFYCSAIFIERIPVVNTVSLWLGENSSYIFVSHAIALFFVQILLHHSIMESVSLFVMAVLYIVLFIIIALLYKLIHLRLVHLLNK